MAAQRHSSRSGARSTINSKTRLNDSATGPFKPLIVGPYMTRPSRFKPIIVPRPTMLRFAPYGDNRSSRSFFILMIYLITLIILLLALLQWEMISLYEPMQRLFRKQYWVSVTCFLICAILLAIFMLIQEVRYMPVFNWILLIFTIELMVIGIGTLAAYWEPMALLAYFLLSMLMIIIFLLIGSFMPCDLTANAAGLFLASALFFILSQMMIVVYVTNPKWDGYYFAFAFLILCIVFTFVMYHAQLIRGGRYAEINATDGLFAVIVLFSFFCLIFMLFAYGIWPQLNSSKGEYRNLPTNDNTSVDDDNADDDNGDNDEYNDDEIGDQDIQQRGADDDGSSDNGGNGGGGDSGYNSNKMDG
ncbi:uncharacterized protein LOC6638875 isoform X1 [Drosophila willistoni]|uniref:uncharacterized protein LOC6638875 isoform X1 n=1 Tax=Drosophila willistoni TaxID=7260 RepID=UPI000C26D43B|nr:uncharacterized protein LOC6638875 isoform X1 [Drosophila willistoni]